HRGGPRLLAPGPELGRRDRPRPSPFPRARLRGIPESLREFMVALGAVSTATAVFTVSVLFIIDRARSGAAVAIRDLNAGPVASWEPATQPPGLLLVLLVSAALAAIVAYPVTVACSRLAARRIHRVRYDLLARAVLVVLVALIVILAGAARRMGPVVAG